MIHSVQNFHYSFHYGTLHDFCSVMKYRCKIYVSSVLQHYYNNVTIAVEIELTQCEQTFSIWESTAHGKSILPTNLCIWVEKHLLYFNSSLQTLAEVWDKAPHEFSIVLLIRRNLIMITPMRSIPAITCPDPGDVANGYRVPAIGPYTCGHHVSYICGHGHQLQGKTSLMCQSDGTFNGTLPKCISVCKCLA